MMRNIDDCSKVGILGGTFNPCHKAHLKIGLFVRDFLKVPIIYLPTVQPLHKDDVEVSFDHRVRMTELLVRDYHNLIVSRYEVIVPQPHTTIDVVRHLVSGCMKNKELYFIIGADSFNYIHSWPGYEELLETVTFVVLNRIGYKIENPNLTKEQMEKIIQIDGFDYRIASRDLRLKVKNKEATPEIPWEICDYIKEHELYI